MLSIGNKKYRNLQEQVGFNTEQIEKIFEVLDGLNVQDNVVIVNDMSQVLTEDELVIINRAVAFIIYNNNLYIKRNSDSLTAYFDVVFSITQSTVISFNSSEIQVTLSNGALGIVNSSVSTYSSTQIDTKVNAKADTTYVNSELALKANLAGANFTGAITSPSIIQNMPSSDYFVILSGSSADIDIESIYFGMSRTGNKLTIVYALNVTVLTTEIDRSKYLGQFHIPHSVWEKLYPTTVGLNDYLAIAPLKAMETGSTGSDVVARFVKNLNADYVQMQLFVPSSFTANVKRYVRIEQTFLLSDNLAQ